MQIPKNKITLSMFLFLSSQLISRTALYVTIPIFPIYLRDLGFAIADLGIVTASLGAALIIFEPLWGSLLNRLGAKSIFLSSTLAMALVLFSHTIVRDLAGFAFVRFLIGVLASAMTVSTRTLMSQTISTKERASGTWFAIYAAAGVIGPIVGGIIATQGYMLVFYAATFIATIGFIMSLGTPRLRNTDSMDTISEIKGMDKHEKRTLLIASALIVLPYFLRTVFLTYVPVFAKESPKFSLGPVEIGLVVSAIGVIGFFAPFAFSEIARKKGVKKTMILGMALQASSFMLLPLVTGFSLLCFTAVLLGLGDAATNPCMMAFLMSKIRSPNHGLAIGVYGAGEDLGALAGPLIVGSFYQYYGAEVSFYLTAALMLANIMFATLLLAKAAK